jgi:multidrug efflux system outer membrane protein
LNAFKEVNDALIRHKYNLQIVDTQVLRVMALKNYLHISLLQYNEGQIDYLTYLDAERDLFNAQLSQVESVANSIISLVDIYKTMGGSWVNTADRIATEVPKKKN